ANLYRAQRDFIAQVSHELKSPLASLRLHLETIRRRRLSPQKMEVFLDTMLADTERLGTMIDNLLAASRLENRGPKPAPRTLDLSEFTAGYFGRHRYALPRAGRMELDLTPDLRVRIEPEALETVYRNLLENAILYSLGSPQIRVHLFRDGKMAHFVLTDRGRGIVPEERENVFRMFHRVRYPGETIRGSGLGLFIVRATVRLYRGKTWIESAGSDQGTAVHVVLPLVADSQQVEA
ncbi:MAG: HAMP domain-containing histidine kinase, partial [Desulfuromonadales bacterium]|nr:HAMP domain-containing histidine kinase [Desulfuromonadales bacterium]